MNIALASTGSPTGMRPFVAVLAVLVLPMATALSATRTRDADANLKERPVMKVVRMLQDMRAELQRDLDDDTAVHEQLVCWCRTNKKEKTEATEGGEAVSSEADATQSELEGVLPEVETKLKAGEAELAKDSATLRQASELRMKEKKEFHEEEKRLLLAIQACEQAIVVLGKHHPELAQVRSVAQKLKEAKVLSLSPLGGPMATALSSFLSEAQGALSFLAVPGFQSYTPQSGQVFGILKQMKDDFEGDLRNARAQEQKAETEYQELKVAKDEELSSGKKVVTELDEEHAANSEKYARALKEGQNTKAQLELDRAFLADLEKKCSQSDAEFNARVKSRNEEILAVEDAIKILNKDTSFDTFDKTVNMGFLQVSADATLKLQQRRQRAASLLAAAAANAGSPGLALLATKVQLNVFEKVQEDIEKMAALLQTQQRDEVEHRDWCIEEMNKNEGSTAAEEDKKAGLSAKVADIEKTISTLSKSIKEAREQIAETELQMERASENREGENANYQQTVTDQRVAQMILRKALSRMKEVYTFLEDDASGTDPAKPAKYERNADGSKVVIAIETIIADSKTAEAEAMRSEQDAQAAYEGFMKESNNAIVAHSKSIVDMSESLAKAEEEVMLSKSDLKQTLDELESLRETRGSLHSNCDFIVENFDKRQTARSEEIDTLNLAKNILSGMK